MAVTLTLDWPTEGREAHANIDEGLDVDVSMNVARAGNISMRMLPGWRWTGVLAVPDEGLNNRRSRQKVESLMTRWVAGANRMRLYNVARPAPLGTLRGAPTLSASAAKGATSIQITDGLAAPNLAINGSFSVDTDGNGMSDGFTAYSAGSPGTITQSRLNVSGRGLVQRIFASAFGSSASHRVGLWANDVLVSPADGSLSVGVDVAAISTVAGDAVISINWIDGADAYISSSASSPFPLLGSYGRATLTAAIPSNAAKARVYVYAIPRTVVADALFGFYLDGLQIEYGEVSTPFTGEPTLLDGDLIGIGGQRVMVSQDVTLNGIGAGTVNFWPPLRYAVGSGTLVEWDKPKVLAVPKSRPLMIPFQGTKMPGFSVEWVEAWEAPA